MGIASLVLGILSILFAVFGSGFQFIGVILGIIGIVLGSKGKKDPEIASVAGAGLVCSIVGTVLGLFTFIACVACLGGLAALGSAAW